MLHIKDIEAFARINEALADDEPAAARTVAPRAHRAPAAFGALAFARLATSMVPRPPAWPSLGPSADSVDPAESPPVTMVPPDPVSGAGPAAPIPPAVLPEVVPVAATPDEPTATVGDGPVAADGLPQPDRPSAPVVCFQAPAAAGEGVVDAGQVGGIRYDFDLTPRPGDGGRPSPFRPTPVRPATMAGMLARMLFGRR